MSETPQIDPAWIRRRPQQSLDDPTNTVAAIVLILIVGCAFYFVRERIQLGNVIEKAQAASQATSSEQLRRSALLREDARRVASIQADAVSDAYLSEVGTGSSIDGRRIHRCGYAGTSTYQMEPCKAPWQELEGEQSSRRQRAYEDALIRQRAADKLRLEQARWNAAAGTSSNLRAWDHPTATNAQSVRARCAAAKRDRDAAYELAGANRSFEMIRRWTDIVFEACKE